MHTEKTVLANFILLLKDVKLTNDPEITATINPGAPATGKTEYVGDQPPTTVTLIS